MNKYCECEEPGFCERHQIYKNDHYFSICQGNAMDLDCGAKFWIGWERGRLGAVAPKNPILNVSSFCVDTDKPISTPCKPCQGNNKEVLYAKKANTL
jgi:hypothetical protein